MKYVILLVSFFFSVELSAQKPVVISPLEIYGDHIFIKLSVDGSAPLDFIFDTGDGLTVIDLDVAEKLKLPLNQKSSKTSAQGTIEGALIDHNYIVMQGVRLEDDIKVYATSLRHLEMSIGRNIDGIIGYDLLQHYAVEIDQLNHKFKLYAGETYKYMSIGERFAMEFEKYIPTINATVNLNGTDVLTGPFFVITGAGTTLDFNTKFAKKNEVVEKTGDHYSYLAKGLENTEALHYEGRINQLKLGSIKYDELPIGISTAKKGVQANGKVYGIIGNRLLKTFTVIFDYKNKAMYMERVSGSNTEFHVNACGFEIQLNKELTKVLVHRVYERGDAKEAGIQTNDEIISVNGKPAIDYTIPELNSILNEEDTTVELVLSREGVARTVTLDLKEII